MKSNKPLPAWAFQGNTPDDRDIYEFELTRPDVLGILVYRGYVLEAYDNIRGDGLSVTRLGADEPLFCQADHFAFEDERDRPTDFREWIALLDSEAPDLYEALNL